MDLSLKNKRVFISGSSRGIGFFIANSFIQEGANVVINSRRIDDLASAEVEMNASGSVAGDLRNPEEAQNVIDTAAVILGGIDIVVCNVGSGASVAPGHEHYREWQRVFDTNLFCSTNLVEASRKVLKQSKGSIICISSICGLETIPGAPVTYSVAKAALKKIESI